LNWRDLGRTLREQLTWQSDDVLREQVALVWGNLPVTLLASWIAACGQLWFMWPRVDQTASLAWLAYNWLTAALFFIVQILASKRLGLRGQAWAQTLGMGFMGIAWGSSMTVSAAYGQHDALVYTLLVVGGVNSGALGLSAALLPASLAYLGTMLMMLFVAILVFADPAYAPFALLLVIYLLMTAIQVVNTQQAALRGIQLQLKNVELVQKLRHESAQALEAQQAAEQANQDKSKFLAAASHDLRQPLHAMGLFVEALSRSPLSNDQAQVLTHLRSASDATSEMLNTLLDYSRLEAGAVSPKSKPFPLQNLLAELEREFGMQADSKDLFYRSRETTLAAFADPTLVDLVLRNLISNALRYTPKGGLLVACRPRGNKVAVQVWDTGLGIAAQEQKAVFKEFHQLGNPERDRQKGLGLGLAIVQRLCEAMGAQVNLRSVLGKGSMFELVLPLHSGVLLSEVSGAASVPAMDWTGLRVMVIDDEAPVRQGMQSLLAAWGCHCTSFESAQEALEDLARWPDARLPQVLLSDYRLRHDLTGAQAIADVRTALRLRGVKAKLPAIIVTGDTAPERIREAQRTDALLLHKPVSAQALQQALGQAMRQPLQQA
jgi:signal transduction histidine kinase/CheY-like chemotaxis protein